MAIYILVLFASIVLSMISYQDVYVNKRNLKNINLNKRYKKIFILFSLLLILIIGLRDDSIGIDTWNYINNFAMKSKWSLLDLQGLQWHDEIGHTILIILIGKLGLSWNIYAIIMASIYMIPILFLIYKYTKNCFLGISILILSGYWTYPMSTMRQAAAMGIVVIAFLNKDKIMRSILLILLASTFHISALISFLFLIALKVPLKKDNYHIWLGVGLCTVLFAIGPLRNLLFNIMELFGRDTYTYDELTGGWLQEVFFVITVLIGMIYINGYNDDKFIEVLKALYLSAVLLPIVRINPTLFRIYSYFSIFQVVLIPNILYKIHTIDIKLGAYTCYFAVYFYIFFTQTMSIDLELIPYKFFWN